MDYAVTRKYITGSNRPGHPLKPRGMVAHSTDDTGATAQNIRDYFNNHSEAKASAHTVIDWTGIIEMIPEDEEAWHAGPTANNLYIGVELCEPSQDDYSKFQEVWTRAVWYFAQKCQEHSWSTGDVFSHKDISQMYHETDHSDPIMYFAKYGKTWNDFLTAVEQELQGGDNMTPQQAIDYLKSIGLLTDSEYWNMVVETTKYFDVLVVAAAKKLGAK
jgi:N-acetylmuramoyl-L-alanine amidase